MEHLRPLTHPESPPEASGGRAGRAEPRIVRALVSDYDGTLATGGRVDPPTLAALERFRASDRKLVLVTGRRLPDLLDVFPSITLFDRVVGENGAVLYDPAERAERVLAAAPPLTLIRELESRSVPLAVGRVIVATSDVHAAAVAEAIRALRLPLQTVLNKGAIMILPDGVDKATGMTAALAELGVSPADTVAIGDAENDLAFMGCCGATVAVANALPSLKARADMVTAGEAGAGVVELIDRILGSPDW